MRISIVSDIHGNLTAFEAVLEDLRVMSPDVVFHGGDLADGGSSPVAIIDRIRDLGWQGVVGNTDQMLTTPETLEEFASQSPRMQPLLAVTREMAAATREALGQERLAWLRQLPPSQIYPPVALVHASPSDPWRAPSPEGSDAELESVFGSLGQPIAVHGHFHRPYIRRIAGLTVVNTGSVSLSQDGDPRASYLLLDGTVPEIRRVEYDLKKEVKLLEESGMPHAGWVAKSLQSARFEMP